MLTKQENKLLTTLSDEIKSLNHYLNQGIMDKDLVSGWFDAKEAYHKKMVELLQKKYNLKRASDLAQGGNHG